MAVRAAVRAATGRAACLQRRFAGEVAEPKVPVPTQGPTTHHYPERRYETYPQPNIAIDKEEPIFGDYGYRPPPKASQEHYQQKESTLGSIFVTQRKALRAPTHPKKILPPPAKTVALFGCTGYVGSRIAMRLAKSDEVTELRLCTRYPDQLTPDIKKVIAVNPDKCTLEETNVLDRPSINRAVQGCDAVINAVELINEDFYNMHHDVYVRGTGNIANQVRVTGAGRYIHVSGLDAIFGSDSDYADFRAKAEDCALAESFFTTVIRAGHLYGAGYRLRGLGKVMYPTVYPDTKLQPVWVGDIAEAVFRISQDPNSVKRVLDLGGPKVMTHMQFAIERAKAYSGPAPFPVPTWLGVTGAFLNEYLFPNPWTNQNMVCDYEMDQIARTKKNNPHLWTWEDLNMTPLSVAEARQKESAGEGAF
eukprot:TRINITY_DN47309_c0_g1_i1.p1 TRINITY_DN47309_c0_g1~~TRINITY_DN47309_c0_g1_i1.p1  ORF type:complete len:420 (+),score=93.07 TRINITY_DN47309_c0_g1_i1:108-1367(+)